MNTKLLIIEDDAALSQMLSFHFEDEGFSVVCADCLTAAKQQLSQQSFDLILLDQQLPDGTGIEMLQELPDLAANTDVIMMTGLHDLELAIEAIKLGATDFIHKPINSDALQHSVERILETRRLAQKVKKLESASQPVTPRELIGKSDAMLQVSKEIALCASSQATVLLNGESGTGKEVVARLIHHHSGCSGPFIAINCAAIVDNLLESELFGHEKGAFTGAHASKPGKFELAQDGTLFLDEIAELALPLQAKLLRVLQESSWERVGGTQTISGNARIIAATHQDIFALAGAGNFREDLAYRLSVININIPPLRERKEDLLLLANALMQKISERIQRPVLNISDSALLKINSYHWPGNVRELENSLTQAMVHARSTVLTPDLLRLGSSSQTDTDATIAASEAAVMRSLDEVEAQHIQQVLIHTSGHKGNACHILGISRPALDRKIIKYQLSVK